MRRGDSVPRAFQAPVDVHASVDGQVYMFRGRPADSGGSSEDDELNVMELRPRGHDSEERERERFGELLLLERDISQGDNLNKLALQYGCKVGLLFGELYCFILCAQACSSNSFSLATYRIAYL